jgi:hypothetical protein
MMQYCHKDRHIDQWNEKESPKINVHIFSQMIFNKGAKTIQSKDSQESGTSGSCL